MAIGSGCVPERATANRDYWRYFRDQTVVENSGDALRDDFEGAEEQADDPVNATKRRLFCGLGVLDTAILIGIGCLAIRWDEFLQVTMARRNIDILGQRGF